jgi:alpha-mannosidase
MVANRGLPEVEVLRRADGTSEIALTLLRCVGWLSRDDFSTRKGHAGPAMETPAAQMLGKWDFEYSIIPHPGSWRKCMQEARAFETSLRAVLTELHPGSLPPNGSLVEVQGAAFQISAIKQAEDGDGWILRGYNPLAEPIQVRLKLWRPFKHILRADLAEQGTGKIKSRLGLVDLQAGGHEILTLRFRD